MITPDWLSNKLNYLQIHKDLQESILRDITRRIVKTDFSVTDTAAWQAEKLQQSGMLYQDIIKEIAKRTKKSEAEICVAFEDANTEVFNYDENTIEKAGYDAAAFKAMSPTMKKVISTALAKTVKSVRNLTGTTAITSQSAYINACDLAHMQVVSGAFTYQQAIKNAVKTAAKQGLNVIYPSGHISSLDAAVRRAVLTGVNQTTGKLQDMRANDMGIDLMEISAHSGARYDHAQWQGKIVSRSGKKGYLSLSDIGYGTVTGFQGANCRHTWSMFFDGISKPAYTKVKLQEMQDETVSYDDKNLKVYEVRDIQRGMERGIRSVKSQLVAYDEAMKNVIAPEEKAIWKSEFDTLSVKLKQKEAALKDFCSRTGLKRDRFREQVFATGTENGIKSWTKSASQKAIMGNKKELDKYTQYHYNKDGTVVVTDNWIGRDVHKIPEKFKPYAVLDSLEIKGSYYQKNRSFYNEQGLEYKQIHGGHHLNHKHHPYGKNGEHRHDFEWDDDMRIKSRSIGDLTDVDRKENKDIL